jgi:hypothetical protein
MPLKMALLDLVACLGILQGTGIALRILSMTFSEEIFSASAS